MCVVYGVSEEEVTTQDVTYAKEQCQRIKQALGMALVGGVNQQEGQVVNVWVRQFGATVWYGEGYTDD